MLAKRTGEVAVEIRAALRASDDLHYHDIAGSVTDTADEALARSLVDIEAAFLDRHVRELRQLLAGSVNSPLNP
jgi:DnaK suppressor protein